MLHFSFLQSRFANFVKDINPLLYICTMSEEIKQIAERLVGLRDSLDLQPEEIAATCHIDVDTYLGYESGEKDIPVSFLHQIAHHYGVELPALMFGYEPRMSAYFLTRKDKGVAIERTKAYKYQSLAAGFANRKADPFMVTVEPTNPEAPFTLNTHPGQEFNIVMEGSLHLRIGEKELVLHEGDSIIFDSTRPHGMKAIGEKPVKFLAIIF